MIDYDHCLVLVALTFSHHCLLFVIAEWQLYNASNSLQNDLLTNDQTGKLNSAIPSQWGCKTNLKAVILPSYRNDLAAFRTSSLFDLCVFETRPGNKISPHKPYLGEKKQKPLRREWDAENTKSLHAMEQWMELFREHRRWKRSI